MESAKRAGMIGLGNMGGRIARRLAAGGVPTTGFDVSANARDRAGVDSVESVAALVQAVDVVFLSLPDSTVIERVMYEDDGALESCHDGQIVVDLSTAAPESTMKIHGELAGKGVEFLDAAISGGAKAAEEGALSVMVGGSAAALDAVRPLVDMFATRIYHMGGSGSGQIAKLLNNFLNGISLAATAEVMVAGRKAGLDLQQLLDVLNHSSGVNFATLNRFPRIVEGDYLEGGLTNELMAKDIRLYLELLQRLGVTSFTGPATLGTFNLATALGLGDQISNRVVDAIGDIAGGVRIQHREENG